MRIMLKHEAPWDFVEIPNHQAIWKKRWITITDDEKVAYDPVQKWIRIEEKVVDSKVVKSETKSGEKDLFYKVKKSELITMYLEKYPEEKEVDVKKLGVQDLKDKLR